MKFLVCFLALVAVACAVPAEEWTHFKMKHGKHHHNSTHELKRLQNYVKNKKVVEDCNNANLGFECGINHLSDLSREELFASKKGLKVPKSVRENVKLKSGKLQSSRVPNAPASVDWRNTPGVVGPVKDQGSCGSCYTFSANGALEGQYVIKKLKSNVNLAEQNLVDCLSSGCDGGWMNDVFDHIKSSGVVETNAYRYTGVKSSCKKLNSWKAFTKGYKDIPAGDDAALMEAVAKIGPIAIAMDADGPFGSYKSGIYNNPSCDPENPTHAMTLVGYGTDSSNRPFWIIKNSWGTGWGEKGYMRLCRKKRNNCGISNWASYPLI